MKLRSEPSRLAKQVTVLSIRAVCCNAIYISSISWQRKIGNVVVVIVVVIVVVVLWADDVSSSEFESRFPNLEGETHPSFAHDRLLWSKCDSVKCPLSLRSIQWCSHLTSTHKHSLIHKHIHTHARTHSHRRTKSHLYTHKRYHIFTHIVLLNITK